jgi:hypothetical protein
LRQRPKATVHPLPSAEPDRATTDEDPQEPEVTLVQVAVGSRSSKFWPKRLGAGLLLVSGLVGLLFTPGLSLNEDTQVEVEAPGTVSYAPPKPEPQGQRVQLPEQLSENQSASPESPDTAVETLNGKTAVKPSSAEETTVVEPVVVKQKVRRPRAVKPRLSRVDQLFSIAYRRMDSLRLSYPKGDSAYDYFQEILQLDPDNRAAKAGIRQIVRWYIDHAEQALTAKQIKQARSYIKRGLNINGSHPRLIALQNRISHQSSGKGKVYDKVFDLFD